MRKSQIKKISSNNNLYSFDIDEIQRNNSLYSIFRLLSLKTNIDIDKLISIYSKNFDISKKDIKQGQKNEVETFRLNVPIDIDILAEMNDYIPKEYAEEYLEDSHFSEDDLIQQYHFDLDNIEDEEDPDVEKFMELNPIERGLFENRIDTIERVRDKVTNDVLSDKYNIRLSDNDRKELLSQLGRRVNKLGYGKVFKLLNED